MHHLLFFLFFAADAEGGKVARMMGARSNRANRYDWTESAFGREESCMSRGSWICDNLELMIHMDTSMHHCLWLSHKCLHITSTYVTNSCNMTL